MNIDNITDNFEECEIDPRESDRLKAIHIDHLPLGKLSPEMGSPAEWLGTAISHLKVQECEAMRRGEATVTVSEAALGLLMWDWEARAVGGKPWKGNVQ